MNMHSWVLQHHSFTWVFQVMYSVYWWYGCFNCGVLHCSTRRFLGVEDCSVRAFLRCHCCCIVLITAVHDTLQLMGNILLPFLQFTLHCLHIYCIPGVVLLLSACHSDHSFGLHHLHCRLMPVYSVVSAVFWCACSMQFLYGTMGIHLFPVLFIVVSWNSILYFILHYSVCCLLLTFHLQFVLIVVTLLLWSILSAFISWFVLASAVQFLHRLPVGIILVLDGRYCFLVVGTTVSVVHWSRCSSVFVWNFPSTLFTVCLFTLPNCC